MAGLKVDIHGDGLKRFGNVTEALADGEVKRIAARALNHTGAKARTQVVRALVKQTGLPRKAIIKAIKVKRATASRSEYKITASGGDIPLKNFNAEETPEGVVAHPFGQRTLFSRAFIKGGRFPNRVDLKMGDHVFIRKNGDNRWGAKIELARSGVIIPQQMVKGETAAAFQRVSGDLPKRLSHEMEFHRALSEFTKGAGL